MRRKPASLIDITPIEGSAFDVEFGSGYDLV
jgi:hypothetical protein